MDKLMLVCVLILIFLSVLQLRKMSRIYKQMTRFLDKVTGYLQVVWDETEDEAEDEEEAAQGEFISGQEKDMRRAIEQQKEQKKIRDAQVFDAVLSEIFP
jgi:outer membrane lipoprotein-sorting protein